MEIINTKQEHNQHRSVFKVLKEFSYYLNVTDPLIIPFIFIFLSRENAHGNKEFRRDNSKRRRESRKSRITTR